MVLQESMKKAQKNIQSLQRRQDNQKIAETLKFFKKNYNFPVYLCG